MMENQSNFHQYLTHMKEFSQNLNIIEITPLKIKLFSKKKQIKKIKTLPAKIHFLIFFYFFLLYFQLFI